MAAVIPDPDNLQRVAPQPSRDIVGIHGAEAPGEAFSQLGAQVQKDSEFALDHMNTIQAQNAINNLRSRANDLQFGAPVDPNDSTTGGYANVTGNAAMGADGKSPILDTYKTRFQQAQDSIASTLSGGALERYNELAGRMNVEFNAGLLQHVMRQSDIQADQVTQDTIAHAQATAAANPSDPLAIKAAVDSISTMMPAYAARRGNAAADVLQMKALSGIHGNVVEQLLTQGKLGDAQRYFDKNSASITDPDTLTRLRQQLYVGGIKAAGQRGGAAASKFLSDPAPTGPSLTPAAPAYSPTMLGSVLAANRQIESGNDPSAKNPASSAKGATQVLDGTNRDPGFGVTPARDGSIAERDRVGDDYLATMVQRYKGDLTKAFAAYQGPGMVDKLIHDYGDDWYSHLDPDKQAVVQKKLALVPGAPPPPGVAGATATSAYVPMKSEQQAIDAAVADLKANDPNPDPAKIEAATNGAKQSYQAYVQQRSVGRENAIGAAQQFLAQNGGDWNALPPSMIADLNTKAPDAIPQLKAYANASNPMSNPATNPSALVKSVQNPKVLAAMTPTQFETFKMTNFSREDQPKVDSLRNSAIAETQGKQLPNGPMDLDAGSLKSAIDNRLYSIGVLTPGKPRTVQADAVSHFLTNQIYAVQGQVGRKLQPAELQRYIDDQFARGVLTRSTVLGLPYGSTKFTPLYGMTKDDIPAADLDTITAHLKSRGISAPTDEQILDDYWTHYKPLRAAK